MKTRSLVAFVALLVLLAGSVATVSRSVNAQDHPLTDHEKKAQPAEVDAVDVQVYLYRLEDEAPRAIWIEQTAIEKTHEKVFGQTNPHAGGVTNCAACHVQTAPEDAPAVSEPLLPPAPHPRTEHNCSACHNSAEPEPEQPTALPDWHRFTIHRANPKDGAAMIAKPRFRVLPDQRAQLSVGGNGTIDFLVAEDDGRFALRKAENRAKVSVSLTLGPIVRTDGAHRVTINDLRVDLVTLSWRRPVDGLDLPAGEPVFQTIELNAGAITCDSGKLKSLTLKSKSGEKLLLGFVVNVETKRR